MTKSLRYFSGLIGLFLLCGSAFTEAQEALSDKSSLMAYYEQTSQALIESVQGLSEAQLLYKPSAEEWSISQGLEHIIQIEEMLFEMTAEILKSPANPEKRKEINLSDQELINQITDRSYKAKAPAEIQPAGIYRNTDEALRDFHENREIILRFIKDIDGQELRNHVEDSPFGPVDGYQSLLFIAGHTARHIAQIEEVKAHGGFPSE